MAIPCAVAWVLVLLWLLNDTVAWHEWLLESAPSLVEAEVYFVPPLQCRRGVVLKFNT